MFLLIHGGSMNVQALENEFDFIQPFRKHWLQDLLKRRPLVSTGTLVLGGLGMGFPVKEQTSPYPNQQQQQYPESIWPQTRPTKFHHSIP
jgi:hypothetical protein